MEELKLTNMQRDALRELSNVGAGNAATALSQLLGRNMTLGLPNIDFVPVDKLVQKSEKQGNIVAAVYLRIFGDITGRALLMFPQDKIFILLDMLMRRKPGETKQFGETEQSALKEIGNIIVSSYLNSIAKFIRLNSVPSVPSLAIDMPAAIFQTVSAEMADGGGTEALLIENDMIESVTKISTSFYLIPDRDAMVRILEALNNTIKGF